MMKEKERLEKLAETGNYDAMLELAESLKWGFYGEVSPGRAAALYRRCAMAPSSAVRSRAYCALGVLYYHGLVDGEADTRRAFDCFLKSVLLRPCPEALNHLADMYRYGQYVEKSESIALSLYLKAASA